MKILNDKKRISLIYTEGDISLYIYYPTPFSPLYCHFEKMTLSRRVRLLIEYLSKGCYKVFYLVSGDELIGYCVVAPGNRRLKLSSEKDIVLGPYFIDPTFRGKGYAKTLIRLILKCGGLKYRYAYDYINKTNIPSIKATLACGFNKCGELDIVGFFHKLIESQDGEYNIYRYIP